MVAVELGLVYFSRASFNVGGHHNLAPGGIRFWQFCPTARKFIVGCQKKQESSNGGDEGLASS
jgi:hypothetical protein